jgi:DNA repair photolyase
VSRKTKPWGTYVDIRVNAPRLLEKEILLKKPKCVLLGSTTECFQGIEKKYKITRQILEILNRYGVYYTILTRSTYITEYTELLRQGFCRMVYFTINNIDGPLKTRLEPKSPDYKERFGAINKLLENKINITPYFSPILPWVSDWKDIFARFPKAGSVEFETLNFRAGNIENIIKAVSHARPHLKEGYERLRKDRAYYDNFWDETEKDIKKEAKSAKKHYNIYRHNFTSYFENRY